MVPSTEGSRPCRGREERASAALEFALVLPLVLIMALALLQVGLLVKDRLVVEEAARAGARHGAVSTDDAEVTEAVRAAAVSLDPSRLDVTVKRGGGAGSPVAVTVVYHAPLPIALVRWLFPGAIDLAATAVMRQETG